MFDDFEHYVWKGWNKYVNSTYSSSAYDMSLNMLSPFRE